MSSTQPTPTCPTPVILEDVAGREVARIPLLLGLNLLGVCQMEELETGSRCGGHGVCGGDRVLILEGGSELSAVTDDERRHLTQAELDSGYRLACQAFPESTACSYRVRLIAAS